jgi:hypothetical protein
MPSTSTSIENNSQPKTDVVESKATYYSKLRRSSRKQLSRKEPMDFKYPVNGKIVKSPPQKSPPMQTKTIASKVPNIAAKTEEPLLAPKISDENIKNIAEIIGPECKGLNKEEILSALMLMQLEKEANPE